MARDISVSQIQMVIADIRAWVYCDGCPSWANALVLAIADILEHILSLRDK